MKHQMLHPADQIVMIMERIYGYGMTTTSGGNLSILDENGDIWITPGGVDKGTLTRRDIMCVHPDGTAEGPHKPSVEFPFHKSVYDHRSDVRAVLHAHPPALAAFSIIHKIPDTSLVPNAHFVCGKVEMAEYAVPGSRQLGEKISAKLKLGSNTVILENHGVVAVAETLFKAFTRLETLDFSARLEIRARRIGTPVSLSPDQLDSLKMKNTRSQGEFVSPGMTSKEKEIRRQMCELIHRAYDQRLFTSSQGTFSQRLGEDSFLITPYDADRKYIEPEDIVKIDGGKREQGKDPSRSVDLHRQIYRHQDKIHSLIIAQPPGIMAFGISKTEFDSRMISESYVILRRIPVFPFGTNFLNPEKLAMELSPKTPLALVENDCLIVAGENLLQVFDRLEVAEFSAGAVIDAMSLGKPLRLGDPEVEELTRIFLSD